MQETDGLGRLHDVVRREASRPGPPVPSSEATREPPWSVARDVSLRLSSLRGDGKPPVGGADASERRFPCARAVGLLLSAASVAGLNASGRPTGDLVFAVLVAVSTPFATHDTFNMLGWRFAGVHARPAWEDVPEGAVLVAGYRTAFALGLCAAWSEWRAPQLVVAYLGAWLVSNQLVKGEPGRKEKWYGGPSLATKLAEVLLGEEYEHDAERAAAELACTKRAFVLGVAVMCLGLLVGSLRLPGGEVGHHGFGEIIHKLVPSSDQPTESVRGVVAGTHPGTARARLAYQVRGDTASAGVDRASDVPVCSWFSQGGPARSEEAAAPTAAALGALGCFAPATRRPDGCGPPLARGQRPAARARRADRVASAPSPCAPDAVATPAAAARADGSSLVGDAVFAALGEGRGGLANIAEVAPELVGPFLALRSALDLVPVGPARRNPEGTVSQRFELASGEQMVLVVGRDGSPRAALVRADVTPEGARPEGPGPEEQEASPVPDTRPPAAADSPGGEEPPGPGADPGTPDTDAVGTGASADGAP